MGKVDALCRSNSSNRILKTKETKPEWLSVADLALFLSMTVVKVLEYNRDGLLPHPSYVHRKKKPAWRKADILEWDAIGRPNAEEFRDKQEMAKRKAMAFFESLPLKAVDSVVSKYR